MKRSEVKNGISNILLEQGRYSGQEIAEEIAEVILSYIQEAGMLPPLNSENYHHMNNEDREFVNVANFYFQWEPENE